uniref:Uncharacterized protein n=1 Tax=Panagrolaimus sp. ES5 TaxID=591445 RepID=A0AC34G747_9BILA
MDVICKIFGGYEIYVGNEPLSFWVNVDPKEYVLLNFTVVWKNQSDNAHSYFEPFGKTNCLLSIPINEPILLEICYCQPFIQNNKEYIPFKIWTENGPIKFQIKQDEDDLSSLKFHVFEEEEAKM